MNEQRLRELMNDSVEGVEASDSLRTKVSAAIGGSRVRRRLAVRGWIAVVGAGLAAAAVLLAVPLIRTPNATPPGPGAGVTAPSTTGALPVGDIGEVLGNKTWYVIGIVADGSSLAFETPKQADRAMRIQVKGTGLEGFDGCHWIGANPALLTSVPAAGVGMSMTANACEPDPVGWKEFYSALSSGPKSWSRDGDVVVLTAAGIEVQFSTDWKRAGTVSSGPGPEQDAVEVLGTRTWYVTRIVADGIPVEVFMPSNRERAMRVQVKGASLTGFDGCNWIGASTAALSSAPPTQVGWSQTDVGCVPIPAGQKEFVAALYESGKSWTAEGGGLVLRAGHYEVTFDSTPQTPSGATAPSPQDVAELLGSKIWYVTGILANGTSIAIARPADSGQAMSLQLSQTGLQGFDGCNRIGASPALLSSGAPSTVGLSQTGTLCTPAPAGQKEYVDALQARDKSWVLNGGDLVLTTSGYEVTFSSTPPTSTSATTSSR